MQKKGVKNCFYNLFLLAKKGELSVKTLISLLLVVAFFAVVIYLFVQKLPKP
ncbi:hypothetical protein HZA97_06425 [Candidatus Woesearchaeota archaeon]|nr:hypothetical protein [Candidatus Woesearchaeota archaeon]